MNDEKLPPSLVLNKELLKQFINGQLEPEIEERVAAHLEARPNLLAKVAAASGDGFVRRLRESKQRSNSRQVTNNSSQEKALSPSIANYNIDSSKTLGVQPVVSNTATISKIELPGYQLIREIGRGGMGVVYLAKNIGMDRLEVLKVLSERLVNHAGAEQRFRQEIRAVSKLNHPNIVTSFNLLNTPTHIAFAMEFVEGYDLHKYIQKEKQIPIGQACSIARQIAAGLQHAHEKGLVHRDIKPSNVMLYESEGQLQLKILDFGLAKATSEKGNTENLTQDGTMLGTPEYMAPEQMLNAAKADIRADIYSLGCTLYHMLAGHAPFVGTQGQIMMAHAQSEAKSVNLVRADVPKELAAIIAKMMAKHPDKRFQTPSQVHNALQPFLTNPFVPMDSNTSRSASSSRTIDETSQSEKDTSVEISTPRSFNAMEYEDAPARNSAIKLLHKSKTRSQPNRKPEARSSSLKSRRNQFFIRTSVPIMIGLLAISFGLWLFGVFEFKTPDGTIIVEQMPPEAKIIVDGKQMEVVWNEGKDKAQVTVEPGKHQLKVVNQGNEIHGQSVSLKGGDSTVVSLAFKLPTIDRSEIQKRSTSNEQVSKEKDSARAEGGPPRLPGFRQSYPPSRLVSIKSETFSKDGPERKPNQTYVKDGVAGLQSDAGIWGYPFVDLSTNQLIKAKVRVMHHSKGRVGFCIGEKPRGVAVWIGGNQTMSFGMSMFTKDKQKDFEKKFELPEILKPVAEWNDLVCVLEKNSLKVFVNDVYVDAFDLRQYPLEKTRVCFSIGTAGIGSLVEMTEYEVFRINDLPTNQ